MDREDVGQVFRKADDIEVREKCEIKPSARVLVERLSEAKEQFKIQTFIRHGKMDVLGMDRLFCEQNHTFRCSSGAGSEENVRVFRRDTKKGAQQINGVLPNPGKLMRF